MNVLVVKVDDSGQASCHDAEGCHTQLIVVPPLLPAKLELC